MLLVLAFPDFEIWPLAWISLVPLFVAIRLRPSVGRALMLGWLTGALFFYASCYWLTYPMIHYAGIPAWIAYALLLPGALIVGFFPALSAAVLAHLWSRWGRLALLIAPAVWVAFEWARLAVTGQLWNAIGYSQAYVPELVKAARIGSVYAVGFLIVTVNSAVSYALLERGRRALLLATAVVASAALVILVLNATSPQPVEQAPRAVVVALQPNVIPDFDRSAAETARLTDEHFDASERALRTLDDSLPRIVVWPESPMNFSFARNARFRERASRFAQEHRTSLLFNSLEPAPSDGGYNAAVLVDEQGGLAAQYDKIRLMPFGEYIPLPRLMPGASKVRAVVGEFTPGTRYALIPLGGNASEAPLAGVFICLESAYPQIARRFVAEGADVLVEITNDAYQGDSAVLRQHMANAVFRAVETGRTTLRITNTGGTARITPRGQVLEATEKFRPAMRVWKVSRAVGPQTFYVRFGDAFVAACAALSLIALGVSWRKNRRKQGLSI